MKRNLSVISSIFIMIIVLVGFNNEQSYVNAATDTGIGSGTVNGAVALTISDASISMTNLVYEGADTTTAYTETRYLYDSESDGGAVNDKISFNEATTSVKSYYYIETTGFTNTGGATYPDTWAHYKMVGNIVNPSTNHSGISTGGAFGSYMPDEINNTSVAVSTITAPTVLTLPTGEGTLSVTVFVSSDGDIWSTTTMTVYYIFNSTTVYFDDQADMSLADAGTMPRQSVNQVGDEIILLGNTYVLTGIKPTTSGNVLQLMMGWYQDETANAITSGTTMEFYMMLAIPFGYPGTYTATITVTGSAY